MAKPKPAVRPPHPPSQANPVARGDRSRDDSPARSYDSSSPHIDDVAAAAAAAKKKNKKGKGKRVEDSYADPVAPMSPGLDPSHHDLDYQSPSGAAPVHVAQGDYAANAASVQTQAQADLLATASDLYRRIERDPHGIPDDDAYWTSLPAHLRTFIRNALPLGQFSAAGGNDPNAKHASTQAMIAVAQQLAQAAQASQRHLEQYSTPGSHPYPPLSFDPAIFADLALHTDQSLSPSRVQPNGTNGTLGQAPYSHLHYSTAGNPPPTQPPGEPLPAPVVLVNEFGEEAADYGDGFSDEEGDGLDGPMADHPHARRDAAWSPEQGKGLNAGNLPAGHHGFAAPPLPAAAKKNKKKKKKNKAGVADGATAPAQATPPQSRPQQPSGLAPPAPIPRNPGTTTTQQPPPGSRAAGKQPMTFSATAKAAMPNGHSHPPASKRGASSATSSHTGTGSAQQQPPQQQQRIWSTSTAEERERIREFWLGLTERERRSLLQVEKDAVLKKMKDQQRHTCSCAVCGRKRSAIESELDVLYNAYYEELEQYANHQQQYVKSGGTISPPPGPGPFPGSVALDGAGNVIGGNALTKAPAPPAQKTRTTVPVKKAPVPPEEDDGYDDELEDDDYEDGYDEEEEEEEDDEDLPDAHPPRRKAAAPGSDVSPLGSSLTVKGGILTVADDLLKNDGQKFLEMMEQLADRRMQRQEDANAMLDALSDEGEDDAEADDLDEEDEGDEEEDALTDEQRMEEGRRMFQIFAARLFEQRVLSAYREKVAQERQLQLLRELEEEDAAEKEREAKRQKENQRKKDKKRQAQLKKEEERLKRESEKAAEEAAAREKLEKQRAAELKKQEEARAKREAEKKAKEEERLRKEEEKRKRQEEERAREAERERKRKEKEEKARQEKEAREAREAERKAKEDEARRQKEAKEKEKKAKEEAERAAQEAARREAEKVEKAAAQAQAKAKQAQEQQRAAANAKAQPPSGPAKSPKGASSAPVSPASVRNNAGANVPRSPAANVNGGRARQVSVPPSPANAATPLHARAQPQPGASIPARPPTAPSQQSQQSQRRSGSQPPAPSGSTLPAPPQGLPARPSSRVPPSGPSAMTAALSSPSSSLPAPAPTGPASAPRSVVSDASSVVSPRAATASRSSSTIGAGVPAGPSAAAAKPPSPPAAQAPIGSTAAPLAEAQPSTPAGQPAIPASFSRGFTVPSFTTTGLSAPSIDSARSPNLPNGVHSPLSAVSGSKSLDGNQSPHGVHEAAYALSSLNFGSHGLGGYANTPSPIGPPKATSPHGRMPSKDFEYGGMRSPSPQGARSAIHRPGPIGPIGRPRRASEHQDDLVRSNSPRLPEGILGSSALGGDDELIAPQPRRTGSTVAPIGGGSALFGFGSSNGGAGGAAGAAGGNGAAGAGAFGSSPWNSSSFASPTSAAPVAPGAAFGNLGAGLGAPGGPGLGSAGIAPGVGVGVGVGGVGAGMGMDPWAPRSQPGGWDRARFAFEQPSAPGAPGSAGQHLAQHQHAHQQPGQQPQSQQPDHGVLGGVPLSPFAAPAGVGMGAGVGLGGIGGGPRSIFDAPGGLPGSPVYRQPHEHRS